MRALLLAGMMVVAAASVARADDRFWVVGNNSAGKCEIVTSNPVVNSQVGGNIWFGDGPYKSKDDAKLARSTIPACPAEPPSSDAQGESPK